MTQAEYYKLIKLMQAEDKLEFERYEYTLDWTTKNIVVINSKGVPLEEESIWKETVEKVKKENNLK